jgi:glutaredoxin
VKPPPAIKIYAKHYCGWCHEVLDYLKELGWPYEEVEVARNAANMEELRKLSGQDRAPTAVIDGKLLVDFGVEELKEFLRKEGHLP